MNYTMKWLIYLALKLIFYSFINIHIISIVSASPSSFDKLKFVDCELNLNGRLKFDACGVCGGDNSTCISNLTNSLIDNNQQPKKEHIEFIWKYADYSECIPDCNQDEIRVDIDTTGSDDLNNGDTSSSFTIGFQTSHPVCFKRIHQIINQHKHLSEHVVSPENCDLDLKPNAQIRSCENFIYHCKPKWITNDWTNCSVDCGFGHQKRDIYCGLISRLSKSDGSPEQILRVDSIQCAGQSRPNVYRQCESFHCSNWLTGPWNECSVNCGEGVQNREVTCRDKEGKLSTDCKLNLKPNDQQLCIRECDSVEEFGLKDQPNIGWQTKVNSDALVGEEPTWSVGEWSSCSQECGQGTQQRLVECKILFKFSGTVATLPEDQCHENKPESQKSCFQRPCDEENEIEQSTHLLNKLKNTKNSNKNSNNEDKESIIGLPSESHHSTTLLLDSTINEISNRNDDIQSNNFNDFLSLYHWIIVGFTECTAPCLGGTQDSIIQCVLRSNGSEAPSSFCDLTTRPDLVTRTCNDKPCHPRWNVSEYGPCSRECGKGIQTRQINCIHEVTRGEENVIQLPHHNCSYPLPTTTQFCAIQDCESRWVVGEWSPCKQRCGKKGKRIRSVKCFKLLAHGEDTEVPEIHCKDKRRPKFKKRCISNTCIPPKAKIFLNQTDKSLNQTKKPKSKPEQTNKDAPIDNSIGFKRTHIDFKKLEDDQRKWKEIKSFINSDNDQQEVPKKNQTLNNWKKILEDNSIDTNQQIYPINKLNKVSKVNQKHDISSTRHINSKHASNYNNQNNHNNNINNFINQNSYLNKRKTEEFSTSGSESHNSIMTHAIYKLHHLQKLLTKLLTRKSVTKSMSNKSIKFFNKTSNNQEKNNGLETNEIDDSDDESSQDELLANNIVENLLLTETGINNLVFDWMISDWSSCSVSHGTGFQVRGLQCMVKLGNTTKAVNEAMCLNDGLRKPTTIKRCGAEWKIKDWSPCKFCIKKNTGIQTRIVQCVAHNTDEPISSRLCDAQSKPEIRQECSNPNCESFNEESTINSIITNADNEEEIDEERNDDKLF